MEIFMKKRFILTGVVFVLFLFMLTACHKEDTPKDNVDNNTVSDEKTETDNEVTVNDISENDNTDTESINDSADDLKESYIQLIINSDGQYVYNNDNYAGVIKRDYLSLSADYVTAFPNLNVALNDFNEKQRNDYDSNIEEFITTACGYDDMMIGNFGEDYVFESCYDLSSVYTMRSDDEFLSFVNIKNAYWGGAQSFEQFECHTFDSQTGKELSLSDVVKNDTNLDEILRNLLIEKYGKEAFYTDLNAQNDSGDYENVLYDPLNPSYLSWCLTPLGINVFFGNSELNSFDNRGAYVQLLFSDYSDILYDITASEEAEFMIPLLDGEKFFADLDNDKSVDSIEIELLSSINDEGYEEYYNYSVILNETEYNDFAKFSYETITPYYVRRNDADYLYINLYGPLGRRIDVIKFIDNKPVFVRWIPSTEFEPSRNESENDNFSYITKAPTNPKLMDKVPDFSEIFCGNYVTEVDGETVHYEISSIDGKNYLNYLGDYSYGAAEIELLSYAPMEYCGNWYQLVKMHRFSGFAFAGDYLGGNDGSVCYLQTGPNCDLIISPGFENDALNLNFENGYSLNMIMSQAQKNTKIPGLIGCYRSEGKVEGGNTEFFMEFKEDGTCTIVMKRKDYPVIIEKGIYDIEEKDGEFSANIEAEVFGYANQPVEWKLKIDKDTGVPSFTDINTFSYLGLPEDPNKIEFRKTEEGDHAIFINPGPGERLNELKDLWKEYSYDPDSDNTLNSVDIDSVIDKFVNYLGADGAQILGQDERFIWLYGYKEVENGNIIILVDRDYAFYDIEKDEYFYIFGCEW